MGQGTASPLAEQAAGLEGGRHAGRIFRGRVPRPCLTLVPRHRKNAENMYYFSELALTLNALESGTAPTDSRLRPDQRLMENGRWDEANAEKQRLEEKQRISRKKREAEAMKATEDGKETLGSLPLSSPQAALACLTPLPPIFLPPPGAPYDPYKALWFERKKDPVTKELAHVYRGGYWESKEKQDWSSCPDIF